MGLATLKTASGGILSYMTRHRTAANLFLVLMLVAGIMAFPKMRAQFFPDTIVDSISVSVQWDGAGPEAVDSGIVQILDPALLAVEGVSATYATSTEGRASITVEFETGWDITKGIDDAQVAVDAVRINLPEDAEDPLIAQQTWRDSVTDVVIYGPLDPAQLGLLADELITRLFAAGVTRTTIRGVAAPEIMIEVPSTALIQYDLSMAEIATAIAAQSQGDPAGDLGGSARIRTGVERRNADDIRNIVLRSDLEGNTLSIGDIARVQELGTDRNRAYFVNNQSAIAMNVQRSAQGDAIDIQAAVQQVADQMQPTLPQGVQMDLIRTRAEAISSRLNTLLDNGAKGLALVLILLFLFLNVRTAFWVAMGIPAAMAAAVALMYLSGLTFNMVSLFALIITLGIVVDDAIVVGEHADFRARQLGEHPINAAENAAKRMFSPVFSATLTTVIAFFALTVVGGRFGDLISDIPFTVIVVLIASLAECFLILPHHMAHSVGHTGKLRFYDLPSHYMNQGLDWVKRVLFAPFIRFVIFARYPVMALVILALASQLALFFSGQVQWRFFNGPERGSITGNFAMLSTATREDTLAQMRTLQETVDQVAARYTERYGQNPVDFAMAEIGGNSGRGLAAASTKSADQLGSIAIELIDPDLRPYSSFAFLADVQEAIKQHPQTETISFRGGRSGPGGDSLSVQLTGADADTLKTASLALQGMLAKYPEVSALEDSLAYDKEELILNLTPQGRALGIQIDSLGRTLRNRLNGVEAATFPVGSRSGSIRVELPAGELSADFLDRMLIRTATGDYVPLGDVVTVENRTGFATVRRENGLQVITISGDIDEENADRAAEITKELQTTMLPRLTEEYGVNYALSGLAEQERRFLADARMGLILALLGIFITLAWIFSSWTRPFVIMAVIPFGLVGTIFGHWVHGVPLSMFSIVGVIGMVGIIINDSIVLITTIDTYAKTRPIARAVLEGTVDRLRPVMLTTLTTVLGLAPLLFERSTQAQFLKPTVITLVYGLGFGMVLVLVVVPALVMMQQDIGRRISSLRRMIRWKMRGGTLRGGTMRRAS